MTALAPRSEPKPGRRAQPHFVRDYQRFVARLIAREPDLHVAMSLAAGGAYEEMGEALRRLVVELGLADDDYLIDVGCGAGRLADALYRRGPPVRYLGCDVVPEVLAYARDRCPREGWRFVAVDGLSIPEASAVADMVVFFSVATHLTPVETRAYLREARRTLRPRGRIVVSYLDASRWGVGERIRFGLSRLAHLVTRRSFKSVTTTDAQMSALGAALGMRATLLPSRIGQSVCVYEVPAIAASAGDQAAATDSGAAPSAPPAGGTGRTAVRRSAPV